MITSIGTFMTLHETIDKNNAFCCRSVILSSACNQRIVYNVYFNLLDMDWHTKVAGFFCSGLLGSSTKSRASFLCHQCRGEPLILVHPPCMGL